MLVAVRVYIYKKEIKNNVCGTRFLDQLLPILGPHFQSGLLCKLSDDFNPINSNTGSILETYP